MDAGAVVDVGSWCARLRAGRVVLLEDPAAGGFAFDGLVGALDPLPGSSPAVLVWHLAEVGTVERCVDEILGELETVALRCFPAWLPGGDGIHGRAAADRAAVRVLARKLAASTRHFGPFVGALAEAALVGGRVDTRRFPRERRAAGLARVLADSYGRDHTVLLVTALGRLSAEEQRIVATVCEWLAEHAGTAVGLDAAAFPDVDRFTAVIVPAPETGGVVPVRRPAEATPAGVTCPAVAGRPHHASEVEKRLDRALKRCEWADGYQWNAVHHVDALRAPVRVDLIWREERCVVELDGDDHRVRDKYAADRRRDVQLQLDGYAVLRFTNDQVNEDLAGVLADIEQYLTRRRRIGDSRQNGKA